MKRLIALGLSLAVSACSYDIHPLVKYGPIDGEEKSIDLNSFFWDPVCKTIYKKKMKDPSLLTAEDKAHDLTCDTALNDAAGSKKSPDERKVYRNSLQTALRLHSDGMCNGYLAEMEQRRDGFDIGTTLAAAGFSAMVPLFSHSLPKDILGILSTGATTSRETINSTVFKDKVNSALVSTIRRKRSILLSEMLAKYDKNITDYDTPHAIADVVRYHDACSLDYALTVLLDSESKQIFDNEILDAEIAKLENDLKTLQMPKKKAIDEDAMKEKKAKLTEKLKALYGKRYSSS